MSGSRRASGACAGFALAALLVAITVMSIAMAAAAPTWKWVVQNDREQELLFRGYQIADAVRRYQAKNGNALPTSLDVLVKGKFLRKAYPDPMTKDGKWHLVRQGEPIPGAATPTRPGAASPSPSPSASPSPSVSGSSLGAPGTSTGGIVGVASLSSAESLRRFNNRDHYNEWFFVAGQTREWSFVRGEARRIPAQVPGVPTPQQQGAGTVVR
jgi:type II secretory pathway pseudopilin PulG